MEVRNVHVSYILSMVRSGLGVMTSRIFGLVRDIVIASVYGASGLTDLFFVAFAIPNLFRQFFAEGAIASAFVPFLSDKTKKSGESAANAYLTQLIFIQVLLVTAISIILLLFAPYVIKLFMPGIASSPTDVAIGATLLRILMPYLFFVSISGLLAGYLNLNGSYYIGYASTSCLNVMMIIGAVIGGMHGGNIYTLAASVFAGGVCQMFMVYSYSWLKGFRFTPLTPTDPDIKSTYKLLIPSLAGVGISQLNFLIGRVIASFLQPGSISWLFYANRLFQFPLGIFSVTISTVSLTELSKARTDNNLEQINKLIDKAIIALILIIIPATIGLVGLAEDLIRLIFARRAFNETDVANTAIALQMYSIGLLFYSLASVFTRVFHSEKNTKTPVKIATITFVVNLIFNLILMKPMGHAGIALASTIASVVNTAILYINLKGYKFSFKSNIWLLFKIMLAIYTMSAIMIAGKIMNLHVLII
ncbi:MAG: murein biosynthesis integral membrane protein MurJ, partial [Deferribacteraceae bacterium]|nr:murein biosynthesis integral membrane protein MurJ [Deferribacteraceae bacterium]